VTSYSLSHVSDQSLLRHLDELVTRDRITTASLLAHIAEVDARRLYLPAGYPSMHAYCVEKLRLSEDAAYKRITAARLARAFPAIFPAVAEGRLHLSGVVQLAPHLRAGNGDELIGLATGKSKAEIEALIASRFPASESLAMVTSLSSGSSSRLAPGRVEGEDSDHELAPGPVERSVPPSKMAPIAAERFALQVTIGQGTHDKLRYAQTLLSHRVPIGDLAGILDRVLDLAIKQLEKQKFAATDRPRQAQKSDNPRTIPAHVQRAVWQRDRGQCAFVSPDGHRCSAREELEFDHVDPVARGGQATTSGVRLLCRAHNQHEAERVFGVEFMNGKRQEAARRAAAKEKAKEVIPWLQALGIRADHARQAAERCESIPDASIEERVRVALSCFGPRTRSRA